MGSQTLCSHFNFDAMTRGVPEKQGGPALQLGGSSGGVSSSSQALFEFADGLPGDSECVPEREQLLQGIAVEGDLDQLRARKSKLNGSTLVILCAVSSVQGMDNQLLASSFAALERLHGYEPAVLGSLVMGQGLFGALAGPIWASLVDNGTFSRRALLMSGCAGWGVVTMTIPVFVTCFHSASSATSRWVFFALCCSNGVALASVAPALQSIIADAADEQSRGTLFGQLFSKSSF